MPEIRCEFCHQYFEKTAYFTHREQHLELRTDGQQNDYATLPPEEREVGDLSDVPKIYIHQRCGAATGMPLEIIRSYLINPYMYYSDQTYCAGCAEHIPNRECEWTETGENLQVYMNRLRAENPEHRPGFLTRLVLGVVKRFI